METSLTHLVVEGFLGLLLVFSEVRNFIERKSLLDRIMAKTYNDYVTGETDRVRIKIPPKENIHIPI